MDLDSRNTQALLRECRELLEGDLGEWVEELAPTVAEELFSIANAESDSAGRTRSLRLRDDILRSWPKLTHAFLDELARNPGVSRGSALQPQASGHEELQLVDDQELSERIALREFVARVSEACAEEMFALEKRIEHIAGNASGASVVPFSPQTVCGAFRAGCEAIVADTHSRTLLLRRLERHLVPELPAIYRAINEVLINAGVLPELKRSYRRAAQASNPSDPADPGNILGTLRRLAQVREPASGTVAAAVTGEALPPGTVAVSASFLQSLQAFQSLPAGAAPSLTNVVRLVRDSEAARAMPALEGITLDIVAMLFDLIFDDDKVPGAVKGLVSRLQIPVLKVAMVDQQFFADRGHPARRFLDCISGLTVRWGTIVNENDPFYVKLHELVERIYDGFDRDSDVFGNAIGELAEFVARREEMEAETSSVAVSVVEAHAGERQAQSERQKAARQAAEAALAPLLGAALPKPVERFLRGEWRAVLQKAALDAGADDTAFQTAAAVGNDLVWSIAPKHNAEERKRLVALLPKLLPALQQGLDRIGMSAEARRPLLDALMALHSAAIRAEAGAPADARAEKEAVPEKQPAVALEVTHSTENGIQLEQVALPEDWVANDEGAGMRACQRSVKHLVRGDWIEFSEEGGPVRRERLTWISPSRSLYLFSNHSTSCAISITADALAHRFRIGTAQLAERNPPLFERALSGAIQVLDSGSRATA
jgi:hypothetical protein